MRASASKPGVRWNWSRLGRTVPWLGCTLLAAACSAVTSYEVLSSFFDGVPNPNPPPAQQAPPPPLASSELPLPTTVQPVMHPPYRDRHCTACHMDRLPGAAGGGLTVQDLSRLRLPYDEVCFTCHRLPEKKNLHAPAILGECIRCHNPHLSAHRRLLRSATPNPVCKQCHTGDTLQSQTLHATFGDRDCSDCHDPHGSDLPFFKKPEGERTADQRMQVLEHQELPPEAAPKTPGR